MARREVKVRRLRHIQRMGSDGGGGVSEDFRFLALTAIIVVVVTVTIAWALFGGG